MLTFDEGKHIYYWDGMHVPGVNEILKATGIVSFDHIPPAKREIGMHFGKVIHATTSLWDDNKLDYDFVVANDERNEIKVIPYLNGWRKFRKDYNITIVSNEQKLYSKKYRFAGTHDRVIIINHHVMLDIKSYFDSKSGADLQTAGYSLLWDEIHPNEKIKERIILRLMPDEYRVTVYKDRSDKYDFLCCLQMHNLKLKRGLLS